MIKVGILDNVVITKTTTNDQGSLVIGYKIAAAVDPMAALNGSGDSTDFEEKERDLVIFPPKVTGFENENLDKKALLTKIADLKDPLNHIVSQYVSKDKIKWDLFKGTGLNEDAAKVIDQPTMDLIYKNTVSQFIAMMQPHVGESGKKMRHLFVRASKAKHYPALRKKFLQGNPFIEPMTIPASASKLKFTKYEIDNGYASGDVVTPSQVASREDSAVAHSLLD